MSIFAKAKKTIKDLFSEYRLVKWPSLRTTLNLAVFVIIISAIITLIILGLDAFFFDLRARFII